MYKHVNSCGWSAGTGGHGTIRSTVAFSSFTLLSSAFHLVTKDCEYYAYLCMLLLMLTITVVQLSLYSRLLELTFVYRKLLQLLIRVSYYTVATAFRTQAPALNPQ